MNIEKKRNEIIEELWYTGRINGLYMGIASNNKTNPLKVYLKRWLLLKGIRTNLDEMIEDFYAELFTHISNIKAEKLVELAENEKKLTATICWIAKCHLFQQRSEKKKHPNVSYFEKTAYNSLNTYNTAGVELTEYQEEDDIEEKYSNFYNDYGLNVEDITSQMSNEESILFQEYINKKGRITKKEKQMWDRKETEILNIVNRIKFNNN